MSSKYTLLVLPVLAVVLMSGCVSGPAAGALGPGVVITDFKPDFTTVNSGDSVKLQLKLQNQGEVRAENAVAQIAGIDLSEWGTMGTFSEKKTIGSLLK